MAFYSPSDTEYHSIIKMFAYQKNLIITKSEEKKEGKNAQIQFSCIEEINPKEIFASSLKELEVFA